MFLQIIHILSKYLLAGFIGSIISVSMFLSGYFLIYKKVLKGKKKLNFRQTVWYPIFIIYIIMVIEETIMSREPIYGGIPIKVFASYKNALYSGECTNIILNIVLFVPFGFILPLILKKCEKWYITCLAGLCGTLVVEILQLITMRGIFEVDDIINNFLGCAIGYGIIMSFLSVFRKEG